jgi:hypothetical protein
LRLHINRTLRVQILLICYLKQLHAETTKMIFECSGTVLAAAGLALSAMAPSVIFLYFSAGLLLGKNQEI